MLSLRGQRSDMLLVCGHLFLVHRTRFHPAGSAVVAYGPRIVHHHGSVIDASHTGHADIGDGAVVEELSSAPLPSHKSYAGVAESVVDSAIEADVRSPISRMPGKDSPAPTPVAGSPQHADGRHDPGARDPVVAFIVVPGPVSGRPKITRPRAD